MYNLSVGFGSLLSDSDLSLIFVFVLFWFLYCIVCFCFFVFFPVLVFFSNKIVLTQKCIFVEWHHGKSGRLTLQDIDNISDRSNGMLRLNILKHYLVKDGNVMALMYKEDGDDPHGRKLICISMYCTYTIKKASLMAKCEICINHLCNIISRLKLAEIKPQCVWDSSLC